MRQILYNILLVGQDFGRTQMRVRLLKRLGHRVYYIRNTIVDYLPGINQTVSLEDRVRYHIGRPKDKFHINKTLISQVTKDQFDIIWVEYCPELQARSLQVIKKAHANLKLVLYSEDDLFAKHNRSYYMTKCIPYYDAILTTKSYNCTIDELPSLGAKSVIYFPKGYDPDNHFPVDVSEADRHQYGSDVGFIGTFEHDRAEKLFYLARHGINVRVWGNGWKKWKLSHPNFLVENKPLYGFEYQKAICATKINLAFLRKINRDLHTDRSIEIPACGGFMLAEDSVEHRALFENEAEAVFFDVNNVNDLLLKVKKYLNDESERNKIATSARKRCIESQYGSDLILKKQIDLLAK